MMNQERCGRKQTWNVHGGVEEWLWKTWRSLVSTHLLDVSLRLYCLNCLLQ